MTNLYGAVENNDQNEVNRLIQQGADVNKTNWAGWSPIFEGMIPHLFSIVMRFV